MKEISFGKHIYNVVTLENGEEYVLDLEEDLEYIQSGSKTRSFGIDANDSSKKMISEERLKEIDISKSNYIPEGYYFEDMICMLKLAVSSPNISLEEKLEMVLQNLNVYVDNKNVKYREKIRYYQRVIEEIFTEKEIRKIKQIDCYKKEEKNIICKNIILLENVKLGNRIYLFSEEENSYIKVTIEDIARLTEEGYIPKTQIPGLKAFLNKKQEEQEI